MSYPELAINIPGIALIGSQKAGKSTTAKALRMLITNSQRISFADALRDEVAEVLADNDPDPLHDKEWFLNAMTTVPDKYHYGPLLQWWGTDFRRAQLPTYWVDKVINKITRTGGNTVWLIDDCRFQNEYDALKDLGFFFIRLGPNPLTGADNLAAIADKRNPNHASELDWPSWEVDEDLPWGPLRRRCDQIISALTHRIMQNAEFDALAPATPAIPNHVTLNDHTTPTAAEEAQRRANLPRKARTS